jgi:two-component system, sensor histidine kinase and response regulator
MFQEMTLPFCQFRILVAESDTGTQRLMAQTLNKIGAAVVLASNGKEALAQFDAHHFDLIFMDLDLPEMDGFATTAAIRHYEDAFADHVPIIAMTSLCRSVERDRCLAAGMDSYIEKPVGSSQIKIALLAFTDPESLQPTRPPSLWDRTKALERVGGDENLLAGLITIFATENCRLLGQIDRALLECRPDLLQQSARACRIICATSGPRKFPKQRAGWKSLQTSLPL